MAYNYEYPYVDPNRYNSDWMLNYMKQFEGLPEKVDELIQSLGTGIVQLSNFVLPETYGAIGNGIVDDTIPIAQAIKTGKPVLFWQSYAVTSITAETDSYFAPGGKIISNGVIALKNIYAPKMQIFVGKGQFIITNSICHVAWYGADKTGANGSTDAITSAMNSGSHIVELEAGIYLANLTIPNYVELRGQGIENTKIYPETNNPIITTGDRYNTIRDLTIQNHKYIDWPLVIGINITKRLDRSVFENIRVENVARGLYCTASMIWNEFYNCMFYGCLFYGIYISTNEAVNNNTFYNCEISVNSYSGLYMDSGALSFDNLFIGCNIENSNVEIAGRPAHTEVDSIYLNTRATFEGCYFENLCGSSAFRNFNLLRLVNSFIGVLAVPVLRISGTPKQTLLQACDGYQISGGLYATDSQKTAILDNCIDIPSE